MVGEKSLEAGKAGYGSIPGMHSALPGGLPVTDKAMPPGHSNSVPLFPFLARCDKEAQQATARHENCLDFAKKYEDPPRVPEVSLGDTVMSWCMVFAMEEDFTEPEENEGAESDEADDVEPIVLVPRECVDLCQRLWTSDVEVHCAPSADGDEIFVTFGLTYEMLVDEAGVTKIHMRLKDAMGQTPFETEMMHHYAPNQFEEDATRLTVFTSAIRQRLTWNRMVRLAGVDLEDSMHYVAREDSMHILMHHLEHNHHIRAKLVKEVLSAHGAFRAKSSETLGDKVEQIAGQVIAEPFFTCEPTHVMTPKERAIKFAQDESMKKHGQEPVTFEGIQEVAKILNEWTSKEPGKSEQYVGTIMSFYPLHCELELEYLRDHWGTFSLICPQYIAGKISEGKGTICYTQADYDVKHWSMTWIPLDSIRDYFGDHVGLYFAWLQLYTRSMIAPAIFGVVTFFAPLAAGNSPGTKPDENPLTSAYSIYLCVWTAMFLSFWKRRENELKFLWGSEHYEDEEEVRRQFVGVMEINEVTKKVTVKHKSATARAGRLTCSYTTSMVLIVCVIIGAFSATCLRFYKSPQLCHDLGMAPGEPGYVMAQTNIDVMACARCEKPVLAASDLHDEALIPSYDTHNYTMVGIARAQYGPGPCLEICVPEEILEGGIVLPASPGCFINPNGTNVWNDGHPPGSTMWQKDKYKLSSAAANTILIVVFGNVYEMIALKMNNWENHRTKTEYEDNLILKNFVFQFVNNYFVLFYIACKYQAIILGSVTRRNVLGRF